MASTAHRTHIDLERLTGIHEHRVVAEGEDSYTLALAAARDALAHTDFGAEDLDLLIVCSITRYVGGLRMQLEPPLSLSLKETLGARRALSFDLSNACAGMMTGVFIVNDLIRQGRIRRGMVVSGEYISQLGVNAAREVRDDLERSAGLADARRRRRGGDPRAGARRRSRHRGGRVHDTRRAQPPVPGVPVQDRARGGDVQRLQGASGGRDRGHGADAARGARPGRARVRRDRLFHPASDLGAGDREGRQGVLRAHGRRAEACRS